MSHLLRTQMVILALFFLLAWAAAAQTTVDPIRRTVRIDFVDLPPYEQITLEGVTGLYWCNCIDPDNPSTIAGTGFTVNGPNLDMQYEGPIPPATNHVTYAYFEDFDVVGFELVDWIVITESNGSQFRLLADRPIVVPEPTMWMGLFSLFGLPLLWRVRLWRSEQSRINA